VSQGFANGGPGWTVQRSVHLPACFCCLILRPGGGHGRRKTCLAPIFFLREPQDAQKLAQLSEQGSAESLRFLKQFEVCRASLTGAHNFVGGGRSIYQRPLGPNRMRTAPQMSYLEGGLARSNAGALAGTAGTRQPWWSLQNL
jgi:hypothetical protein